MANLSTGGVSLGLLLLRVPLGVVFLAHGLRKVVGEEAVGLQGFADDLANLGVPLPLPAAVAAFAAEVLGGIILIVGLGALSRISALVLTFVMLVALFKAHLHNGFFIPVYVTEPGPVPWGCEFNLVLIGMCLCVFFAGPGEFGLLNGKGKGKGGG